MANGTFSQKLHDLWSRLRGAARAELPRPKVLCADDDPTVRHLCAAALSKAGYSIDEAGNGREVLEKIKSHRYAAILLDLTMPFVHGTTLLAVLEREQPEMLERVIVLTGAPEGVLEGLSRSVSAVLRKPVQLDLLLQSVSECCSSDSTIVSR